MGNRIKVKVARSNHDNKNDIGKVGYVDGYVHLPEWGRYAIVIVDSRIINVHIDNLDVLQR